VAEDDDADRKRAALRQLTQNPQTSAAQDQMRQQQQAAVPRDLSQMRPQVIRSVSEQERRAEQVVTATWQLFNAAIDKSNDPALRKAVRDSSLGTLLG
jgi:hypothetical protein